MARRQTSKLQLSGEKFLKGRYEQAAITGKPTSVGEVTSPANKTATVGTAIVAGGLAISYMLHMMSPSPDQGKSEIMQTRAGGLYVLYAKDQGSQKLLHPVTNLASARLIVGKSDDPTVVKEDVISEFPRGLLIGIPSAPSSLAFHKGEDVASSWGVCDWRDSRANLSLLKSEAQRTTIVAGSDVWEGGINLKDKGSGILVRPTDESGSLYLLYDRYRVQLDEKDYATLSALNITQEDISNAITISPGLLNAIEARPPLQTPNVKNHSLPSKALPEYNIGDVLASSSVRGGREYYVVLQDGIQSIPFTIAAIISNHGGNIIEVEDPARVNSSPRRQEISVSSYPGSVPRLETPAAICSTWEKPSRSQRARLRILYGSSLPVTANASKNTVTLPAPSTGSFPTATQYVSTPGKGWYVRVTGNSEVSEANEQVSYIADTGIRYDIMPDEKGDYGAPVSALGLTGTPMQVPDMVARLIPRGSTLDQRAALMQHVKLPVESGRGNKESAPTTTAPRTSESTTESPTESSTESTTESPTESSTESTTEPPTREPSTTTPETTASETTSSEP